MKGFASFKSSFAGLNPWLLISALLVLLVVFVLLLIHPATASFSETGFALP
jgi:hypothetical protein